MGGVKLIGRTTDFKGKTLWEIVGNLRDYGVGRLVVRNMFQRYPEPCYYRILKVQAVDAPKEQYEDRKVRVTVEKVWRGVQLPQPIKIFRTSYKADYALVPKEEEFKYLTNDKRVQNVIIPNKIEFPPLFREFLRDETGETNPMMNVHFNERFNKMGRLAKDNEKPTIEISMGLGKPTIENLYKSS